VPRRPARLLALAAVWTVAACETAAAPQRQLAYPLEDPQSGLTFHWTADRLPVRYWVAGGAGQVQGFVRDGLLAWAATFLHGEFRGVVVADSAAADVFVFVEPGLPPPGGTTDDPPVLGACEGVTSYDLELDEDRLVGPFRVTVAWDTRYADVDIVNCLERVTIHEVGHTIGLFGHSANELDLMHGNPRVRTPSPADQATAEVLYHTRPNIVPPAGR
jgi:hypothetical protein